MFKKIIVLKDIITSRCHLADAIGIANGLDVALFLVCSLYLLHVEVGVQ